MRRDMSSRIVTALPQGASQRPGTQVSPWLVLRRDSLRWAAFRVPAHHARNSLSLRSKHLPTANSPITFCPSRLELAYIEQSADIQSFLSIPSTQRDRLTYQKQQRQPVTMAVQNKQVEVKVVRIKKMESVLGAQLEVAQRGVGRLAKKVLISKTSQTTWRPKI